MAGIWSVAVALAAATLTVVIVNYRRLPALRESMDAGANSSVLPVLTVASLVGFGAVVAALPAFATGARRGAVDSGRAAGFARRRHERARRAYRYSLRRDGDRARCTG